MEALGLSVALILLVGFSVLSEQAVGDRSRVARKAGEDDETKDFKAVIPRLCAKPSFWDSSCRPNDNSRDAKNTWNSIEIGIGKMPFLDDLWLHIDIFDSIDPPIEISEIFVSVFNLMGQPVGRFAPNIPCLNNHRVGSGKAVIPELYSLLVNKPTISEGIEVYNCPPVSGLSTDEDPPTQAFLRFKDPVKSFYFHYKFTPEEYKSLRKDSDELSPITGVQVIAVLKDKQGLCHSRLFSKAHHLTQRAESVNSLKITQVPVDCHVAGGVLPYKKSNQKELLMSLPANDLGIGFDFILKHPQLAERSHMPKVDSEDTQRLIKEYNGVAYNYSYDPVYQDSVKDDKKIPHTINSQNIRSFGRSYIGYVKGHDVFPGIASDEVQSDFPSIVVDTSPDLSPQTLRKQLKSQTTNEPPRMTSKADLYVECGHTKGCLGQPRDCVKSKSCDFIVSYHNVGNEFIHFDIVGFSKKWIAISFSYDTKMGDDSVMECVRDVGDNVNVYLSWNYKTDLFQFNVRIRNSVTNVTKDILSETKGRYIDGDIYCSFTRKKKSEVFGHVFDLENKKYFVHLAVGSSAVDGPEGNIIKHDMVVGMRTPINFFQTVGITGPQIKTIKTHGTLMLLVWMIIVPFASFFARYFKETFVKKSFCGFSIWYMVHIVGMSFAVFATIGSVVALYAQNHSYPGKGGWDFHTGAGVTMMSLMILQIPLAVIILKFNSRYKYFFINFIHGFDGHALFLLGFATIYKSRHKRDGLPCSAKSMLIAYIVCYFSIHLIMSYHVCYTDFVQGKSVSRTYTLGPLDIPQRSNLDKDEPGSLGRKIVLPLFALMVCVFGIILVTSYLSNQNVDCISQAIMSA